MKDSTTTQAGSEGLPEFGPDTIEARMRARIRETIEEIVQEDLEAVWARRSRRAWARGDRAIATVIARAR